MLLKEDKPISKTKNYNRYKVSRMDFEILANIYSICKKKKISEREISFLMGKDNKYFAKHINPFVKDQIKTEYLETLRSIASTSFQQIIPNNVKANETVDIEGTHSFYGDEVSEVTYYKFGVTYDDGTSRNYRWKIETAKGERAKVNLKLVEILRSLIDSGYFHKPKFALTLYLHLKKQFKSEFCALEIQIALAKLCNKKADPEYALEEGSKNSRLTYGKILNNKDHFGLYCQDHKIWIIAYLPLKQQSPLYFIWYEDTDGEDKLLTDNNVKIINAPSVDALLELLRNSDQDFVRPDNLESWLNNMTDLAPIESTIHSPSEILKGFKENNIDRALLTHFVNLFNLYGDLGHQDPIYGEILNLQDIPSLRKAWDFFYGNHFWKTHKQVKFNIDRATLVEDLDKIVRKFERFLS